MRLVVQRSRRDRHATYVFRPADYTGGVVRDGLGHGGMVAVADVNGDKIPDVIVNGGNLVMPLLGNGNGTFR